MAAQNVTKAFGSQVLLREASIDVQPGEKIGLIGGNGIGKTTLMNLLTGHVKDLDGGQIINTLARPVPYLRQIDRFQGSRSVYDEAADALADLEQLHDRAEQLAHRMAEAADPREMDRIGHEHHEILHQLELRGGYNYAHRVERVLHGLGFADAEFTKPIEVLSGGQCTRLAIAKILLASGEVVVLDEPTNHLDIEATEWLETYLRDFPGAALVASHDRWFLDAWATRIVEFERQKLYSYPGNYSKYVQLKEERLVVEQRAYEKQQEQIAKYKSFIRRYHFGVRSSEARDRAKKLERIERDKLVPPDRAKRGPAVRFSTDARGGEIVCDVVHVAKRYGHQRLFEDVHFTVVRGERVGIIGPNGSGKTTLLKIILGEAAPDHGSVRIGHNIQAGYHDQNLGQLDDSRTVIQELSSAAGHLLEQPLRDHLARFNFTGEDKDKSVAALSGGERTRLALAKLTLSGANLLILDEPTNHLDVYAREALTAALDDYDGTVLFVTHDRRLLNDLATRILRIENGRARLYHGNYETYLHMRKKAEQEAAEAEQAATRRAAEEKTRKQKAQKQKQPPPAEAARHRKRGHRYEKQRMDEIELETEAHGDQIRQLEADLLAPEVYKNGDRIRQTREQIDRLRAQVAQLEAEWAELAEKTES
jgi:ATP-binding cassette subfamily F protein 3